MDGMQRDALSLRVHATRQHQHDGTTELSEEMGAIVLLCSVLMVSTSYYNTLHATLTAFASSIFFVGNN
jgi:hypothetical protein